MPSLRFWFKGIDGILRGGPTQWDVGIDMLNSRARQNTRRRCLLIRSSKVFMSRQLSNLRILIYLQIHKILHKVWEIFFFFLKILLLQILLRTISFWLKSVILLSVSIPSTLFFSKGTMHISHKMVVNSTDITISLTSKKIQ